MIICKWFYVDLEGKDEYGWNGVAWAIRNQRYSMDHNSSYSKRGGGIIDEWLLISLSGVFMKIVASPMERRLRILEDVSFYHLRIFR